MIKIVCIVSLAILLSSTSFAYDLILTPQLFAGSKTGTRAELVKKGVIFNLGYGGEVAHNFSGGDRKLTEYTDQIVAGVGLDSEKMGYWHGGAFQLTYTDRNGNNLGQKADIGNNQLLQEVYGRGQTLHNTDFWYEQKFVNDMLQLKLGMMTVGEDFASFSCDFQNLTFCGSQPGNIVGSYWVNWPTSRWGARLKVNATEKTNWQIAAYEVNPKYVDDTWAENYGRGFDSPAGDTGSLIPIEFGWHPMVFEHVGSYKFGAWYNTSPTLDIRNGSLHGGTYGAYINFEQFVTTQTSLFLNVTQADRNTAGADRQVALGTQYHGPFDRERDVVGLAVGSTDITLIGSEYVSEVYYSYSPMAWIYIRPNAQYVLQPGGTSANPNAFVGGLKFGVTL